MAQIGLCWTFARLMSMICSNLCVFIGHLLYPCINFSWTLAIYLMVAQLDIIISQIKLFHSGCGYYCGNIRILWKDPRSLDTSKFLGKIHAPWIYMKFAERSMIRAQYPHFTEISTFRGYWPLVCTLSASIDFCDLYWYIPQSSLGSRRHISICSGIAARKRHSSQEMQPLNVLRITVGIATGKVEEYDTPIATGVMGYGLGFFGCKAGITRSL